MNAWSFPKKTAQTLQYAGKKIGLVVDEWMGEFQTVIKPLSSIFKHIKRIGGSTIPGSGEVALIWMCIRWWHLPLCIRIECRQRDLRVFDDLIYL